MIQFQSVDQYIETYSSIILITNFILPLFVAKG